ncbi:trypsin-like peptidase domain-containing protein [Streptomyces sp. NPDC057540]|uniref:trypsin-like peptidase domain-containing protein n=1 Tax=Streptomyces sp. NPDC057540 TaxID=3346160 RepID=UPI0036BAE7E4
MRDAQEGLERVAMVVRRDSDGTPRFAATGFLLAPRLAICAGHGFTRREAVHEVRLPGQSGRRAGVEAVFRHRNPGVDLALLVLGDGADPIPPVRWGVVPPAVGSLPFVAVGFPDFAVRGDVPVTRQMTGSILLGSFLGSHEMELSLDSPAPRQAGGSPWQGVSGAGVLTRDGVLVGVCTSHHVPAGAASLTAAGLSPLTEDPEFRRLLAEHGVDRVASGPLASPAEGYDLRRRVRTHAEVVRDLRGRRNYLDQERLPFVHPGTDHDSHPDRLFVRLTADRPRGVLLIGPAGSGKTRTCFEVAQRADRAGWRVLHVQADSSVDADDVAASVLSGERGRVLLVLDYLDACPQLDLHALGEVLIPDARRRGVTVACLASVRPGSRHSVHLRGSARVLDDVFVRDDWPHQSAIITQVLRHAAPDAVRHWGLEELSRLCGRRPVTALLIARAIEEQGLGRLPLTVTASVRPGELLAWLREGMRRDALATGLDGSASPLDMAIPGVGQLAFAVAAVSTPQPRQVVEQTVDTLLAAAGDQGRRYTGRHVVDTLISLGWLDEADGRLVVVHDIVTDELLMQSLMPAPGWSVHQPSAEPLLTAVARHPRTFAVFTGHLRRLAADLTSHGPTHQAAALDRFCGEWLTAHADALGRLLEPAGRDGEHALLALVTSEPWQRSAPSVWNALVTPWLARAEGEFVAQPFLSSALRASGAPSSALVEACLDWLSRRGRQTDAELLLRALLARTDLPAEAEDRVVECTLSWVPSRPDWRHTPTLLKRMLTMDHPPARLARVTQTALGWVTPFRTGGVGAVTRDLLQRQDVDATVHEEAVARAFAWVRAAMRTSTDVGPSVCVLLEHDLLPETARTDLFRLTVEWLETSHGHVSTGRVLRCLLIDERCPPKLKRRAADIARSWLAHGAAGTDAQKRSQVVHALLAHDDTRDAAAPLLDQLASAPDGAVAPEVLQRLLLHHEELSPEQARATVTHAFAWLEDRQGPEGFAGLLSALLRLPGLTAQQLRTALDHGFVHLMAHPDEYEVMALMLSQRQGLTPARAQAVAEVSLRWLPSHGGKTQRAVLASFLTRPDLTAAQERAGIDIVLNRMTTDTSTKSGSLLRGLLRHPALDADQRSRAVDCALRWLELHHKIPKAFLVLEVLLALPSFPAGERASLVRLAETWLASHADLPFAGGVRAGVAAAGSGSGSAP